MPKVEVLKPHMHTDGRIVHPGELVDIDEARRAALAANGIVSPSHAVAQASATAKASTRAAGAITSGQRTGRRRTLVGSPAQAGVVQDAPSAAEQAATAKAELARSRKAGKAKPRPRQRKPAGG